MIQDIQAVAELPKWFPWIVGVMIISNLGTMLVAWKVSVKTAFEWGKIFASINTKLEINSKDINNAHTKIRKQEDEVTEIRERLISKGIIKA